MDNQDFITLMDENNEEITLEIMGSAEDDKGQLYLAAISRDEPDSLIILRSETDENGQHSITVVDDEEEFQYVCRMLTTSIEAMDEHGVRYFATVSDDGENAVISRVELDDEGHEMLVDVDDEEEIQHAIELFAAQSHPEQ